MNHKQNPQTDIEDVLQKNASALKAADDLLTKANNLFEFHGLNRQVLNESKLTPAEEAQLKKQTAEFELELEQHRRQARETAELSTSGLTSYRRRKYKAFI